MSTSLPVRVATGPETCTTLIKYGARPQSQVDDTQVIIVRVVRRRVQVQLAAAFSFNRHRGAAAAAPVVERIGR
jgi:hypothetical protein